MGSQKELTPPAAAHRPNQHQETLGVLLPLPVYKQIDMNLAGVSSPSPVGQEMEASFSQLLFQMVESKAGNEMSLKICCLEEPQGSGTSMVAGQELFSPIESGSVGQPVRRTDHAMRMELLLDAGASLWLQFLSASSTTALLKRHTVPATKRVLEESAEVKAF